MSKSFFEKIEQLKNTFSKTSDIEEKYLIIMEMGKNLKPLTPSDKTTQNKIEGCQSTTYINTIFENNKIFLTAESDALISSGLAAILIQIYNDEKPEIILKYPPVFLDEIGIKNSISPSRANGLAAMYQRLQKDALYYLQQSQD